MVTKPLVIVTRKLPDAIETRMRELFDARLNVDDKPMSPAELAEALKVADVLVPTLTDRLDSRLLAQAGEKLKLIANFGTGVDHIDVESARSRGVIVTNTPGVLTEDTADMTMALILSVPRRITEGLDSLRAGEWGGWSPTGLLGRRIYGKRLGHRRCPFRMLLRMPSAKSCMNGEAPGVRAASSLEDPVLDTNRADQ